MKSKAVIVTYERGWPGRDGKPLQQKITMRNKEAMAQSIRNGYLHGAVILKVEKVK